MTKKVEYKKVFDKETLIQKTSLNKLFELSKNYNLDKALKVSKEELIMQGKK